MGDIQKKFDLFVSELNKNLLDLLKVEIDRDLEVVNNILDISYSYQDDSGSNFGFSLHYQTRPAPIKMVNGSYVYDDGINLDFRTIKDLTSKIDEGFIHIHVNLNQKKINWGPEMQRQCDKFRNSILKFYPKANVKVSKWLMVISYQRDEI